MKRYPGIFPNELMQSFPSRTAAFNFGEWVANHVGLEQVIGLAGWLEPEFVEVRGHVFWDSRMAETGMFRDESSINLRNSYGDDPETVERYFNVICLAEFFLLSADAAVEEPELVSAFAKVLHHFWGRALRHRFPEREFRFEIAEDLYGEDGLCLTFWQVRS